MHTWEFLWVPHHFCLGQQNHLTVKCFQISNFEIFFFTACLFQRAITFSLISITDFPCSGRLYVGYFFNLIGSILFLCYHIKSQQIWNSSLYRQRFVFSSSKTFMACVSRQSVTSVWHKIFSWSLSISILNIKISCSMLIYKINHTNDFLCHGMQLWPQYPCCSNSFVAHLWVAGHRIPSVRVAVECYPESFCSVQSSHSSSVLLT